MHQRNFKIVLDSERAIDKPIVALTQCKVTFGNSEDLAKCIDKIRESDEQLSKRPMEDVLYDWQHPIWTRGNTLFFGVRWFDKGYFEDKKDVYKNRMHDHLFANFNANAEDFTVRHFQTLA